jgi:hypothetical protein
MNVFDFINSIHYNNVYLFNDPQAEKEYIPPVVNKALSYFPENILYVNEINIYHNIPKKWQYDFYMGAISKRKRYMEWDKKDNLIEINISAIKEYYNYSRKKAVETLSLLNDAQINYIKEKLNKGGQNDGDTN